MDVDEAIEWIRAYADGARTAAQQVLTWHLDALRWRVGLVEVVDPDTDFDPYEVRLLPTHRDEYGQAWGVFVRDVSKGDVCTCNFSHYSVLLDDLPDDVNPHAPPCPFAD